MIHKGAAGYKTWQLLIHGKNTVPVRNRMTQQIHSEATQTRLRTRPTPPLNMTPNRTHPSFSRNCEGPQNLKSAPLMVHDL